MKKRPNKNFNKNDLQNTNFEKQNKKESEDDGIGCYVIIRNDDILYSAKVLDANIKNAKYMAIKKRLLQLKMV